MAALEPHFGAGHAVRGQRNWQPRRIWRRPNALNSGVHVAKKHRPARQYQTETTFRLSFGDFARLPPCFISAALGREPYATAKCQYADCAISAAFFAVTHRLNRSSFLTGTFTEHNVRLRSEKMFGALTIESLGFCLPTLKAGQPVNRSPLRKTRFFRLCERGALIGSWQSRKPILIRTKFDRPSLGRD